MMSILNHHQAVWVKAEKEEKEENPEEKEENPEEKEENPEENLKENLKENLEENKFLFGFLTK